MRNFVCLVLLSFVAFQACTRRPLSVLNANDMQTVIEDLYIAEAIYNQTYGEFKTEEEQRILINSVLLKHDITRAKFDSSLVWYSDNLDELNKVNETVGKSLSRLDSIYRDRVPSKRTYKFSDFSINTMPYSLNLDTTITSLVFRIDSIKLYNDSIEPEKFSLDFDVLGMDTVMQSLNSRIYYQYRDTLIIAIEDSLYNGSYSFSHIIDTIGRGYIKSINGYIHFSDSSQLQQGVLLNKIHFKINNKEKE